MSILKKLTKCVVSEKIGKLFFESTKSNSDRTRRRAARFRSWRTRDTWVSMRYRGRYRPKRGWTHAETPHGGKSIKSTGLETTYAALPFHSSPAGKVVSLHGVFGAERRRYFRSAPATSVAHERVIKKSASSCMMCKNFVRHLGLNRQTQNLSSSMMSTRPTG
jgi:hypothetical protein